MSALDRDKAQAAILEWEATEPMPLDDLLDRLEECVQPNQVGICGNTPSAHPSPRLCCMLPAGHEGWHECLDYEAPGATAGGVIAPQTARWGKTWTDLTAEAKLAAIATLCDGVIARTGLAPDLVREIRAVIEGSAA